ncbi:hypothetical protein [Psychrosphaera algicola]|uniref:Lipoprotein n=1 Tax=Psychrosphaera algicola TaxID=3023714 RepID=A0ABT5FB15_9GAMM|nr:hypothetical protein [Psychrosphaera sp. G1-22]MDC2887765.1 hypothetical protein [Psychrosphaera sp. G1-22]
MKNLKTTNHSPLIAILFAFSSVFAISGCGEATASMDKEEEEKKKLLKSLLKQLRLLGAKSQIIMQPTPS